MPSHSFSRNALIWKIFIGLNLSPGLLSQSPTLDMGVKYNKFLLNTTIFYVRNSKYFFYWLWLLTTCKVWFFFLGTPKSSYKKLVLATTCHSFATKIKFFFLWFGCFVRVLQPRQQQKYLQDTTAIDTHIQLPQPSAAHNNLLECIFHIAMFGGNQRDAGF